MKIINGKLYKETTIRRDNDRRTKVELTLYEEVENKTDRDDYIPEYVETGNTLGIINIDGPRFETPDRVYYKDEFYNYLIHVENLFRFGTGDDYIVLYMKNPEIKQVTLDHKALTYISLLCGARHDITKATKLNISDEARDLTVFVIIDDNGSVEDILYSTIYDKYETHDIQPEEYYSAYNVDIKKYLRNIVNGLIESDLTDKYSNIDLSKLKLAKLGKDIELPILKNKDQSAIIITEDAINKLPKGTCRVNLTVEFDDCEDKHLVLELPRRPFPAKDGMYAKNNDASYIIPITEVVGSIMYWETFNSMSYNLEHEVFDYCYYDDDIIGFDTPGISLEDGVYLDLVPNDSDYLVQRFYAQDRSAYANVWEIYNCDKFERAWIAYINHYSIDKM